MNTTMDDDPIRSSADLARQWQEQEAQAYANASRWLTQAANGEVPGDCEMPNPPNLP